MAWSGIDFGPTRIFVTGEAQLGERSRVAVRPEDVVLLDSEAELPSTTARNRIQAAVVSVSPRGATYHVVLDAGGVQLASSVSRASTAELGLAPGSRVLAVFKATAVRWRPVGQSESGPDLLRSSQRMHRPHREAVGP